MRPLHVAKARFCLSIGVAASVAALAATHLTAQDTATIASSLPAGEERDLFVQSCAQCHAIGMATGKRRSADEWNQVVHRMIELGAPISEDQAQRILAYLNRNYALSASDAVPVPLPADRPATARFERPSGPDQWPAYGGGGANMNWSTLTQITPRNVARLRQKWTYRYGAGRSELGDLGIDYRFEITPLIIGGVMYISTPASPNNPDLKASVTALNPETGALLWKYESPLNIHGRGLAYWRGDATTAPRLFFGTDRGYLMAVDVTTGQLAPDFGLNGRIDAYVGVASEVVGESRRSSFTLPNPATVYENLVITGARPGESGPPAPRGDIRAWDARTGRLVWSFHTIPMPGEPNSETYVGDEWRDMSGANAWSTMSLDEKAGIVYAVLGDANGDASGPQLYSSSVVALDAKSGKLLWFRQITHHDIWDWDLPTPTVLLDLETSEERVPAILVTGKQGLVFLFNRLTGEPLNGFEERPTPQPSGPSTKEVWPTQPFPLAPGPIARTGMVRDEIPDLVPGMQAFCQSYWDEKGIVSAPFYAPRQSHEHATISYPSTTGGPNWGGGAYNPDLGLYFINIQNLPEYREKINEGETLGVVSRVPRSDTQAPRPPRALWARPFTYQTPDGQKLSCGATPWGELVAINVHTQKIAWRTTLGTTPGIGAKGRNTGAPNIGGSITTRSGLLFIGATNDRKFRAFDAKTGKLLWEAELEASAHATPITYLGKDGRQYVVVAAAGGTSAGGAQMSDTLVAYTLP